MQLSTSATDAIARQRDRSAFSRGYEARDREEARIIPLDLVDAWNEKDWYRGYDAWARFKELAESA